MYKYYSWGKGCVCEGERILVREGVPSLIEPSSNTFRYSRYARDPLLRNLLKPKNNQSPCIVFATPVRDLFRTIKRLVKAQWRRVM